MIDAYTNAYEVDTNNKQYCSHTVYVTIHHNHIIHLSMKIKRLELLNDIVLNGIHINRGTKVPKIFAPSYDMTVFFFSYYGAYIFHRS